VIASVPTEPAPLARAATPKAPEPAVSIVGAPLVLEPMPPAPTDALLPTAVRVIQSAAERGSIPVALILIAAVFLAIQNRIDRRDPKLALAPVRDEPEYLEFTDPPGAPR
jgi:hypothetical protein